MRVEAVCQRTLAELASRASPLWMIFAPLAVDARPENNPEVVKALKQRTSRRHFEELAVAMTVLADALRQSIEVALASRGMKLTAARRAQLVAETRIEVLQRWLTRAITAERTAQVFVTR